LRPMQIELNCLKRADGSCSMAFGDTVVLASCFGPGDCKASKQLTDRALLEIVVKPKVITPLKANEFSALEALIEKVCSNAVLAQFFPRHVIGMTIQEMQNEGDFQATAINSACAVLLDAGIPMRFMFAAVSIFVAEDLEFFDSRIGKEKLDSNSNFVTLVFESTKFDLVGSLTNGCMIDVNDLKRCIGFGQKAVGEIFDFFRSAMERKLSAIN